MTNAWTISAKNEMVQGVHLAANTYKLALFLSAAALDQATTAYSSSNESSGAGYTAGGVTLAGYSAAILTSTGVAIAIVQSAGTATVTLAAHGFVTGQTVIISGASQSGYNLTVQITVTAANTFTYPVAGGTVSPATGSPIVQYKAATLTWTSPSWTSATITARYGLIYNSSVSNKSVAVLDFASDIVSTNGTFAITFPAVAAETALLRLI